MKKRILSILLLCCMVLTLLPTTVSAADGPMNTVQKFDVSIDVYNRTSDISIKDSRSYYIYSSVPDKLRDDRFRVASVMVMFFPWHQRPPPIAAP